MAVKTNDIITEQSIQDVVRGYVEEDLIWRQAFNTLDASGVDNDTVEFPVEQDFMGQPQEIAENGEFPFDEEDVDKVKATVKKYGFAVPVSREAQADSVFDVVARQVEKQSRKMAELLNDLAYSELSTNLHPNSPAGGLGTAGTLEFTDILDGRQELLDDGYSPSACIVNVQGEADLLNSPEFQRATELGDDTILDAQIGRVAGLNVFRSNAGNLTGSSAIIVDPTEYGYEVVKEDVATDSYYENSRQSDVFQIWTRRTYKTTDADAAIQVDG